MSADRLRGLYAVTPDGLAGDSGRLLAACAAALTGGARLLQYRDKRSTAAQRAANATALRALCQAHGALFIVNDDAVLAETCAADGVHLGASDGSLAAARLRLGAAATIGASCGASLARAEAAAVAGASYLAFGRYFPSRTKPDAPQAAVLLLAQARARFGLPVCAIGGVTPDNAGALIDAGADMVAAVDGLFGDGAPVGIESRARAYARLFTAPSVVV